MRLVVGLKQRLLRVHDQFWEWLSELPEPIVFTVLWLAAGTLLCLWIVALLYLAWHALRWVGKA